MTRLSNAERLGKFVKDSGLSMDAAAAAMSVTRPTLIAWVSGDKEPKGFHRQAIERWTCGVVLASEWPSSREEQAMIEKVAPFSSRRTGS